MDLDEVLHEVGDNGKYQRLMLWLVFLPAQLSFGCHAYSMLFMTWTPDHWCKVQQLANANISDVLLRHLTVPKLGNHSGYSRCTKYRQDYNIHAEQHSVMLLEPNSTWPVVDCDNGWVYNRSLILDRETAVMKWDLVCSREDYAMYAFTAFIAAGFIGQCISILFGALLGKRALFFACLFVQCAGGIATAFSPNFLFFIISRCVVGLTIPAILISPTYLAYEFVGCGARRGVSLLLWASRSFGVAMLAATTCFVKDYSNLALATTVPFLAFFLYGWVFPESPKWLLSIGRYEETGRLLRNIATTNGTRLSPDYVVSLQRRFRIELALMEDRQRETGGHNLGDLLSTPNMRRKIIVLIFILSFSSTACLGLTYYAFHVKPGEDVHLQFSSCAAAEVLSVLLAIGILNCLGRRCATFVCCAFGGSLCLFNVLSSTRMGWLVPFISHVAAKLFAQTASIIIHIWTREQIPSVARQSGFCFIETSGLLLPISVPYMLHQGKQINFLPMSLFGGFLLFSSILSLSLPETRLIDDLQTLHDGEMFGKYRKWRDCLCTGKPKADQKNGIIQSMEKKPQSPILGLLRKRDSFHLANAEGEIEVLECHSDTCSAEEAMKVTVL